MIIKSALGTANTAPVVLPSGFIAPKQPHSAWCRQSAPRACAGAEDSTSDPVPWREVAAHCTEGAAAFQGRAAAERPRRGGIPRAADGDSRQRCDAGRAYARRVQHSLGPQLAAFVRWCLRLLVGCLNRHSWFIAVCGCQGCYVCPRLPAGRPDVSDSSDIQSNVQPVLDSCCSEPCIVEVTGGVPSN